MAKNIQVNLTFTADTNAAKQQMNQLQQQLNNLAATPISVTPGTKMAQSLQQATQKAVELKVALNNATNVNTGKLNFSKFSQELKRNKTSLQDYAMQLKKLGPEGVQAFSQLANAIRQSETPLISLQGKAAALGKTLANTARWMISSSMLQGLTSAFSGTIDYAKELNESLTSIRVVTGKSVEDMSKFAKEANKAAKALGATTTEYTDASLIYYQQGLSDKEVKSRTETTIKLANVVGEQASTVSEWMTAIWNNFDDGSQKLEYYADVLAKLGAATASSADEIAGGIEKFAAVSETVGLSYEYAAAALATITAETRQSEDVVGTSLKTIFARIENLKLGETLEDGTTLGQYSEALAKVGVHIQDANGNLRNMDNILNDIGARWDTLNNSEQVALAQSVAGIRQYNQFMALMSNWDVMEDNVEMAKEANGELEHQHNIWETGIEGATNRVKANLEEIKNSLLDENDLIPLLNMADGFLTVIGDLIDSLGGLPGLLTIIASIGLKIWGPQAAGMLMSMTDGIRSLYGGLTGKTVADRGAMAVEATNTAANMVQGTPGIGNEEAAAMSQQLKDNAATTRTLEEIEGGLTGTYKEQVQILQQVLKLKQDIVLETAKAADQAVQEKEKAEAALVNLDDANTGDRETFEYIDEAGEVRGISASEARTTLDDMSKMRNNLIPEFENKDYRSRDKMETDMNSIITQAEGFASDDELKELKNKKEDVLSARDNFSDANKNKKEFKASDEYKELKKLEEQKKKTGKADDPKRLEELTKKRSKLNKAVVDERKALDKSKQVFADYGKKVADGTKKIEQFTNTSDKGKQELLNYNKALDDDAETIKKNNSAKEDAANVQENLDKTIHDGIDANNNWTTSFISTMQGVASAAAGLQMITGAFDSLTTTLAEGNAGMSDWLTAITSILFGLPMLLQGLQSVNRTLGLRALREHAVALATKLRAAAEKKAAAEAGPNADKTAKANAKESASFVTKALTALASLAAKFPWGTIAAVAIGAIVAGLIGAAFVIPAVNAKKDTAEQEETQSADIEAGKKAIDVGEGWKEQSDSMDDLIENHKRLQAANNGTVEAENKILEAQQAIIDQLPALIDEYNKLKETYTNLGLEEGIKELEGLQALYEKADAAGKADLMKDIEAKTDELDKQANKKIAEETEKGVVAATQKTLDAIGKQTKDNTYGGTMTWHVGDVGSDVGEAALHEALGYEGSYKDGGIDITLDASDPAKFIEDYEKLQDYVNKQREQYGSEADDTVREVAEGLDAAKEAYEELKELYSGSQDFNLTVLMEEEGIKPETINSYSEFLEIKEKFIAAVVKSGKATEEEAKAFFDAQKTLSSYASVEQQAAAIGKKLGDPVEKRIKNYAKNLSEEELQVFLKIDFNRFQTEQAFKVQMEYLKKQAEAEENKVEFQASLKAFESLKSGMGAEDYEKLQGMLNWGEDGLMKFSEFLTKEFTVQQEILAQRTKEKAAATLADLKAGLAILKFKLSTVSEEEQQYIKDQIELQEIQIGLLKIEQKEAEITADKVVREREKILDSLREEIDLYYELNNLQREAETLSDKIATAKDREYGAKRIALMKLENEALAEEIRLNDKTIKQAEEEKKFYKKQIEKKNTSGIKLEYDSYGNISNYTEIDIAYRQKMANAEAIGDKTKYEKLKDEYDQFTSSAEKYAGTIEKIEDTTEDSAEKQRQILDNKLEELEYTVDIKLEVKKREFDALERQLERLDDPAYDGAEKVSILQREANNQLEVIDVNKQGIRGLLKEKGVSDEDVERYMSGDTEGIAEKYGLDDETTMQMLTDFTDNIIEAEEELYQISEEIGNVFSDAFDAWYEKLANVGDQIATQSSILSNYKNIVDTMGQKRLGLSDQDLRDMEDMQNQAVRASVANTKAQMDLTKNTLATVREKMTDAQAAGNTELYEYWAEQEEKLNKQLAEDTEAFTAAWGDAIQTAYDIFSAESQRLVKEFDDAIAGANFSSMEELEKYFDRQQELEDRYLETYKQSYELSKLNRQLEQNINKTDNVKSAKVLRDLQKEIEDVQKSGKQMTEYELNALQKKYDLKLAEIALEDAQNAKSTVRLKRDSQGNFGYIYTADQVEVDKAQQNYEDKLYALQELNDSYLEQLQKNIISNRKAMSEELAALNMQDFESDEEYWKAVNEITEKYTNNEEFLLSQVRTVMSNNQQARDNDLLQYGSYAGSYGLQTTEWITNFNETTLGMATGFETIDTFHANLTSAIGDPNTGQGYLGKLDNAYDNFSQNLEYTFNAAGITLSAFGEKNEGELGASSTAQKAFTSFKDHVQAAMFGKGGTKGNPTGGVGYELNQLQKKTDEFAVAGKKALIGTNGSGGLAESVDKFYKKYKEPMQKAKGDADALDTSLGKLAGEYTIKISVPATTEIDNLTKALEKLRLEIEKTSGGTKTEGDINITPDPPKTTGGGSGSTSGGSGSTAQYTAVGQKQTYYDKWGNSSQVQQVKNLNTGSTEWAKASSIEKNGQGYVIDYDKASSSSMVTTKAPKYGKGDPIFMFKDQMRFYQDKDGRMYVNGDYDINPRVAFGTVNASYYDSDIEDWFYSLQESSIGGEKHLGWVREGASYYNEQFYNLLKNTLVDKSYAEGAAYSNFMNTPEAYKNKLQAEIDTANNHIGGYGTYYIKDLDDRKAWDQEIKKYDTGGYTGSWGPEGRLAMLHQKEIVLNAHDTENLLTAVSMIREISDKLESNALAMRYLSAIGNYNAAINTNNHETLQQEVTIHAEFPNATNHSEIEEAFGNLVNLASQYANRK